MKKILLFSLALMTAMSFYSCKDDNNGGSAADADRLFRPMFRTDNNTGKGATDPYNSVVVDRNNMVIGHAKDVPIRYAAVFFFFNMFE